MKKSFIKRLSLLSLLISLIFTNIGNISAKTRDTVCEKNLQIEIRPSYGFIICHHPELKHFKTHLPMFEISLQQVTLGNQYWQSKLNYPAVGINFIYSGLGGNPELGQVFSIYPYLSFNFLKSQKNQLNMRLGVGMSYLTNKFDAKTNYKNTFIGSNLNAALAISFEYNRFITKRLSIAMFVGLTHFSNGSRRAPNNGLNIAHAGISTKYFINEPKLRYPEQPKDNQQFKSWKKENLSFYIAFTYAIKDIDEYIGYNKSWSVYNVQIHLLKRLTRMSKLGIGFDIVYDMTDKEILKVKEIEFSDVEILKPGINLAYELMLNSTSFMFHFGTHLAGKEMCEGYVYQKLGIKQNLGKHFFATMALTLHYGWADNVSFGLGYKIN